MVQRKMLAADDLFKKALTLDPNQTDGLHGYSQLLAVEGRIKESLAMRLKLQALEPFVINYVADTALIYWLDKDDETAIKMLDEFRPGRTAEIAQIHSAIGKYKEAASLLREMTAANYLPGVLEGAASLLDRAPSKTVGARKPAAARQSRRSSISTPARPTACWNSTKPRCRPAISSRSPRRGCGTTPTRRCARPRGSKPMCAISGWKSSSARAAGRRTASRQARRISPATRGRRSS